MPALLIVPADERHLDAMMMVMHAAFDPRYGEAWSAAQLLATMAMPGCWARLALQGSQPVGFTLCRAVTDEVELLLIAVAPQLRRQGAGSRLLARAQEDALARGCKVLFLEVREDNQAARYLYQVSGFAVIGRRADYYAGKDGSRRAAITMRFGLETLIV
ncbi:ribosomal protein S18-alanine N-acetyltransferase [Sandarakinorhabdus sp.]|uniref:ribosomal protein S18-alanine N-acetyltransferase n=1 Tax=Sandarakinorhabdus sp. TaxID=1916663 RepID=UPI003F6EDE90